jgi:PhnB protein
MPTLDSYLFFNGNCAEAMRFYERVLGAKMETMLSYGDSPMPEQCPPSERDKIMHACLLVEGRRLMASDTPSGQGAAATGGFSLSLSYPSADEARRVFAQLAEGGTVMMPMDKTFWAETFGMLTDRFGTPWMVSGGEQQG